MDLLLIENDKNFCKKYTIDDVYFKELDKILIKYISRHNKKFDFYLISCKLIIKNDDNFTENIETIFFYYTDIKNIIGNIIYNIYKFIPKAIYDPYFFCNIKETILYTINNLYNMTYEYYIKQPMCMLERRINMIIAKNPQLINSLDRNKSHPLIRNNSHIPFQ